jgi:hypothetical protein
LKIEFKSLNKIVTLKSLNYKIIEIKDIDKVKEVYLQIEERTKIPEKEIIIIFRDEGYG